MRSKTAIILLAAAGLAALPLAAQNYVTNGSFDSNLTGWNHTSSAHWSPSDANGSPGSGSAALVNTSAGARAHYAVVQCLTVPPGARTYTFSGKANIAQGQGRTGVATLQLAVFSVAGCSTAPLFARDSSGVGGGGVWSAMSGTLDAPAEARAIAITLINEKTEAGGQLEVLFDDVRVAVGAPVTLTIPSSASIHGNAGTFFHSDLWVMNRSTTNSQTITASYHCFAGQTCAGGTKSFNLGPRQANLYPDVVGTLFAAPESAGAIDLRFESTFGEVAAASRVYTPSLPSPTNGTAVPARLPEHRRTRALFLGLGANGGNVTSGFRSNAGAYNPDGASVSVTFSLYNGATGAPLGSPLTRTWGPSEAYQITDVFTALGAGASTTTNAYLVVTSTAPIFPFVTVIDNQSGDSVWLEAIEDE